MLISKTPLAVAAMLFAAGGLGVTSAAWAVSDSSQLPVMVVSATGYQQEALRAPASITVVEHDQIQRKPVSDLPKFQGRAGVEWYATEQLELDFYVRGGGKSRRDDYDSKGEPERQRTSSYAELNVGAYYKPVPNLSLAVLAQNLADRRYRNPDELQAAGRALDMEVRWSF